MSSNKPILSISILISNRLDTIRRCLDSLAPLMQRVSSELILVDTSGNPEVNVICHEYTDQVEKFTWCNDFSKARNTGLKRASGEWFMFLDDDEWIAEYEPLVHFFQSGEYKKYGAANYIVRNFVDKNFINYSDSWVSRLIKIGPNTEFRSKIHEYMYPVEGEIKNIYAIFNHSGYIYATQEEREKHFIRNSSLLLRMIEEEPWHARWKTQLAQEYRFIKKWDKLEELSRKSLYESENEDSSLDRHSVGTFYVAWIEALTNMKKYDEALEISRKAFDDKRITELAEAMLLIQLAFLQYKKDQYQECEKAVKQYFVVKKKLEKDVKALEIQQSALIVSEALDRTKVSKAYYLLMICGIYMEKWDYLTKYFSQLDWKEKVVYVMDDFIPELVKGIGQFGKKPIFVEILSKGYKNSEIRRQLIKEITFWQEKDEVSYQRIIETLAETDADDWFSWYCRIQNNPIEQNFDKLFQTIPNILIPPEDVFAKAEEKGIDIQYYWKNSSFDTWKGSVDDFIEKATIEQIESLSERLMSGGLLGDVRLEYYVVAVARRELVNINLYVKNREQLILRLKEYVEIVLEYYSKYYQEHMFIEYVELMPEEVQIAKIILTFLEYEKSEVKLAAREIKKCVDINSKYAVMVKTVYKYLV